MADDGFTVTPWQVEGHVDYDRLLEKFGTERISQELLQQIHDLAGDTHMYLRRQFFYAHRDLDTVLNGYADGDDFFLYTGRAPSGEMHLGHIVPFYMTKWMQDRFDVNVYIQIPDEEKFWAKGIPLNEIDEHAQSNLRDIAAVGFDPDKTFIFKNREYISHMYDAAVQIAEKVNYSVAKAVFGFESSTNIGMVFYPALQMVPTFFEHKRCLIPCAIDQDPYWRIQRDIAESFGYHKASTILSKFIPALTGPDGKMSSSKPKTTIMLDEDPDAIRDKVMKHAHSGGQKGKEEHREKGADLAVDVAYQWLYNLFEPDDDRIEEIGRKYENGELLTGEVKQILVNRLTDFLAAHQERKQDADEKIKEYMYDGSLAEKMWEEKVTL